MAKQPTASPVIILIALLLLGSFVGSSLSFIPSANRRLRTTQIICMGIMDSKTSPPLFQPTVGLTTAAVEKAIAAGEREAERNGWKVTIAITDTSGPMMVKRCNGAFPASYDIAVEKAKTAVQFQKKTGDLEKAVNVADGRSRTALLSAPFVLMRGGVPIFMNNMCIGAVGVSGVAPDQDEQVAFAAVDALNEMVVSKL
jgi:glc operon protein GlcG